MLQYHHQPTKWQIQTGLGWSYGGSYPSGGGMYQTNGGYNFYGYSNQSMNSLIAATHAPHSSPQAAQQALNAYQLFAAKHLPNLWMPVPKGLTEVPIMSMGCVLQPIPLPTRSLRNIGGWGNKRIGP